LAAAGCDSASITSTRVDGAVGSTFANLYALRLAKLGQGQINPAIFHTHATCGRGAPTAAGNGAGADWVCNIVWFTAGTSGASAIAVYAVQVKADGCYTADGDGPQELNGLQTMITADGKTVTNPLWQFDSCFEMT
jgi:ABC-2 type transport system permease protein